MDISHGLGPLLILQRYLKRNFGINSLCCSLLQTETDLEFNSIINVFGKRPFLYQQEFHPRVVSVTTVNIERVSSLRISGTISTLSYLKGLEGERCLW